jgi:hypothetical protein
MYTYDDNLINDSLINLTKEQSKESLDLNLVISPPLKRTCKKWRMRMDDSCLCGEGAETFLHMQLACKLKNRRAVTQGAHDDVVRGVWDTRVGTCADRYSVAEREILVRKWRGQLG